MPMIIIVMVYCNYSKLQIIHLFKYTVCLISASDIIFFKNVQKVKIIRIDYNFYHLVVFFITSLNHFIVITFMKS